MNHESSSIFCKLAGTGSIHIAFLHDTRNDIRKNQGNFPPIFHQDRGGGFRMIWTGYLRVPARTTPAFSGEILALA